MSSYTTKFEWRKNHESLDEMQAELRSRRQRGMEMRRREQQKRRQLSEEIGAISNPFKTA